MPGVGEDRDRRWPAQHAKSHHGRAAAENAGHARVLVLQRQEPLGRQEDIDVPEHAASEQDVSDYRLPGVDLAMESALKPGEQRTWDIIVPAAATHVAVRVVYIRNRFDSESQLVEIVRVVRDLR